MIRKCIKSARQQMLLGQQTHVGVDDLMILYLGWSRGLGCDLHWAHTFPILPTFLQYFGFLNGRVLRTEGGKEDKLHRNSSEHWFWQNKRSSSASSTGSSVDLNPCPRTLTAKLITIFTTNREILHVMIPETVAACPTSYFATHFLPFLS